MALRPIEPQVKSSAWHEIDEFVQKENNFTTTCQKLCEILRFITIKIQNGDEQVLSLAAFRHVNVSAMAEVIDAMLEPFIILSEPFQLPECKNNHQNDINQFWIQYHTQLHNAEQTQLTRRLMACFKVAVLYQKHLGILEKLSQIDAIHSKAFSKISLVDLIVPVQRLPQIHCFFSLCLQHVQSMDETDPARLAVEASKHILDEMLAKLEEQHSQLQPLCKSDLYQTAIIKKNIDRLKQYAADSTIDWFRETSLLSEDKKTILHHVAGMNSDQALPVLQLIWEKLKAESYSFKSALTPDILDEHSATPLHHAALQGSLAAVTYLLEQGANMELKMDRVDVRAASYSGYARLALRGYTPLHCAAYRNNAEIITCLIQHGANLCAVNSASRRADQITPASSELQLTGIFAQPNFIAQEAMKLADAIQSSNAAIVKNYAAESNSWLALPLKHNFSAICLAIYTNQLEMLKLIVENLEPKPGANRAALLNTSCIWPDGSKAIEIAVDRNHTDIVKYLLEEGVDSTVKITNSDDSEYFCSILHQAVLSNHDNAKIIQLLLDHNKHLLAIDNSEGRTPNEIKGKHNFAANSLHRNASKLARAIQSGDVHCVYRFAQNNIHWLHIRLNEDNQTALHLATLFNQMKILEFILSALKQQFVLALKQGDLWMLKYYTKLSPQWLSIPLNDEQHTAIEIANGFQQEAVIHFITKKTKAVRQYQIEFPDQPLVTNYTPDNFTLVPLIYLAYHITCNMNRAEKNLAISEEQKVMLQKNIAIQQQLFLQLYHLHVVIPTLKETTLTQCSVIIKSYNDKLVTMVNTLIKVVRSVQRLRIKDKSNTNLSLYKLTTSEKRTTLKKLINYIPSLIEYIDPVVWLSINRTEHFKSLMEHVPQLLNHFITATDKQTQAKTLLNRLSDRENVASFIAHLPVEIALQHYEVLLQLVELVTQKEIDRNTSEVQLVEFLRHSPGLAKLQSKVLFFSAQLMQARMLNTQSITDGVLTTSTTFDESSSISSMSYQTTAVTSSTSSNNFDETDQEFDSYGEAITHYAQLWQRSHSCMAAKSHVIQLINIHLQSGGTGYYQVLEDFLKEIARECQEAPHQYLYTIQLEFTQRKDLLTREDQALAWYQLLISGEAQTLAKIQSFLKESSPSTSERSEYYKAQWACIHIYLGRGCETMYSPMLSVLIKELEQYLQIKPTDEEMRNLKQDALQLQKALFQKTLVQEPIPSAANLKTDTRDRQSTDDESNSHNVNNNMILPSDYFAENSEETYTSTLGFF